MSWIKIRTNLATDPAISSIALRLKMPPRHVLGSLVAIWSWADALTADGFVAHASASLIDELAGKKGFAAAMQAVDWITLTDSGITFPRWDRHNGSSAKARSGEAERKQLQRSAQNASRHPAPHGQNPGHLSAECPDNCPEPVRTIVATREDKIRGDKNTEATLLSERRPAALSDAEDYFIANGSSATEAAKFFDHFEANGWKQGGRTPIKSWQAAARNWIRRSGELTFPKTGRMATAAEAPVFDANAPHAHTGGVPCALPSEAPAAI